MSRLERRACSAKAVAEYFALIADAHRAPHPLATVREVDEELGECATEFGAAMEKFCADHALSARAFRSSCKRAMQSKIKVTSMNLDSRPLDRLD
jgi:hypothetical protein